MNVDQSTPSLPLFSFELFPETFAAFLRHQAQVWRTRRTDRFTPMDINLAEQRTGLQGLIQADLVNAFLREHGTQLKIPAQHLVNGDEVTLYLPAVSEPKRLLLDFSVRDEADGALPILNRSEGAQVAAWDLLSLLSLGRTTDVPALDDGERSHWLRVLLATLAFQNPHRLAERIDKEWKGRTQEFALDVGLAKADLQDWVKKEIHEFVNDENDVVLNAVGGLLAGLETERRSAMPLAFSPAVRPEGLRYFPTIRSMLAHGIQDLLKNIIQAASPWPNDGAEEIGQRAALMQDPVQLAACVRSALAELPSLDDLISNQRDPSAASELARHLDRWTAYVVITIKLGKPFLIKFDQLLPLLRPLASPLSWFEDWKRLVRTVHEYPLALKDATAVHADLVIPEKELRFGSPQVSESRDDEWLPVDDLFGYQVRLPEHRIHLYSSKRPEEKSPGEASEAVRTHLFVRVPVTLNRSVVFAYVSASIAFLTVAIAMAWITSYTLYLGKSLGNLVAYVTLGALMITLSLWLTGSQHPRPIVYKKLWLVRKVFAATLILTLGSMMAYAIMRAPV